MKVFKIKFLYFLISCLLGDISQSFAQRIIVETGVSINSIKVASLNSNLISASERGKVIQVGMSSPINRWLCFKVMPGLLQKNYSIGNKKQIYQHIRNDYFTLPLEIAGRMNISKKLAWSNALGVYYAYWLQSEISGFVPNVFNTSDNSEGIQVIRLEDVNDRHIFSKYDSRSEYGWVIGSGIDYKIYGNFACVLNVHYFEAWTSQQKTLVIASNARFNHTFTATIGISYRIGLK